MNIQNDSFSAVSLGTENVWNHFLLCNETFKVSAIPLHCLRMNLTSQSFVMRKKDYSSDDGLHTKRQQLETWKWRLAPKKSCRQKAEGEVITIWVHPATRKKCFKTYRWFFRRRHHRTISFPLFRLTQKVLLLRTSQLLSLFVAETVTCQHWFQRSQSV